MLVLDGIIDHVHTGYVNKTYMLEKKVGVLGA